MIFGPPGIAEGKYVRAPQALQASSSPCLAAVWASPQTVGTNATRLNRLLDYWTSNRCNGTIRFTGSTPTTLRLWRAYTVQDRLLLDASARAQAAPLTLLPANGNRQFLVTGSKANLTAINLVLANGNGMGAGGSIQAGADARVRFVGVTFRGNRVVEASPTTLTGGAVNGVSPREMAFVGCTFVNNR
jgi:hypothetical protein